MKTRDKILLASLDAFAEQGVARVSTNHIADNLDISPGTLYHHFKNKQAIIEELYRCFTTDFLGFMRAKDIRIDSSAKVWLVLSLSFQLSLKYRFVFRDANYILSKYPELERPFKEVITKTRSAGDDFCQQLSDYGLVTASPEDIDLLATNLHLVFTQWISYVEVLPSTLPGRNQHEGNSFLISRGIQQIISLFYPYMDDESRAAFAAVEMPASGSIASHF